MCKRSDLLPDIKCPPSLGLLGSTESRHVLPLKMRGLKKIFFFCMLRKLVLMLYKWHFFLHTVLEIAILHLKWEYNSEIK